MELTMENLSNMHGVSHAQAAGELMNAAHARPSPGPPPHHRSLVSHGRSAMVSSMASILEGAGEYRNDAAALTGHLHAAAMSMCEPGMGLSSTYTTLAPLQHLPPISTVSDKFHPHHPHHPHAHHAHPHHAHQRLAAGNVSGSFTLMRDERAGGLVSNLYGHHYAKDVSAMGAPLSPLSNGLGALHGSQNALSAAYGPTSATGFEPHAAMLSRSEEHLARSLGGGGGGGGASVAHAHAVLSNLNGMHPHGHLHAQAASAAMLAERERHAVGGVSQSGGGGSGGGGNQVEEINTKEVAQRITAELKRYSIPQAIFAQRILCRSQGTLSDLLRNPKPWSKLKSGRETFRRMWKWLQEPEFQRMSALRLAACKRKEQEQHKDRNLAPKKQRLVFTDLQRRTLIAIFKENKRPSKEMQITISQQLGLELSTVSNFFMNARRRCVDRWHEDPNASPGQPGTSATTFSKA
ncbi:one cut domain family member 3 isoform X2 [Colossoma macropomum]|uniref:one cut domain family member 3 isoform X2 n=1 Tax=Colossoma macropomum TaxID=42526 RepID=UPI00186506EF|nr:one cut domain family member 3 isoform X2 [Colossoma macropomum]